MVIASTGAGVDRVGGGAGWIVGEGAGARGDVGAVGGCGCGEEEEGGQEEDGAEGVHCCC